MAQYHKGLKAQRTCALIPECISDKHENVSMTKDASISGGTMATVLDKKGTIPCSPLLNMLRRVRGGKPLHIDFWSL